MIAPMKGVEDMMVELLKNVWDSLAGRLLICGLAFGWVPFYFLSLAAQELNAP